MSYMNRWERDAEREGLPENWHSFTIAKMKLTDEAVCHRKGVTGVNWSVYLGTFPNYEAAFVWLKSEVLKEAEHESV